MSSPYGHAASAPPGVFGATGAAGGSGGSGGSGAFGDEAGLRGGADHWRAFAAAASPGEFCQSWLALQCAMVVGTVCGVVVLKQPDSGAFAPAAAWPSDERARGRLADIAEKAVREGKGVVIPRISRRDDHATQALLQIAYPLHVEDELWGVVAIEVEGRHERELGLLTRQLQWGAGWIEVLVRRSRGDPHELGRQRMAFVLDLVSHFLEQPDSEAAAIAFTTELATFLDCDRVSLGRLQGPHVQLLALSHNAVLEKTTELARGIEAAMEESVDQACLVRWPPAGDAALVTLAHAALAADQRVAAILTLPLSHEGRIVGALTAERSSSEPFSAAATELVQGAAALVGPLVEIRRAQERSLWAHLRASVAAQWHKLTGDEHGGLKLGLGTLALLAVFFTFASGTWRITATTNIEGLSQRVVAAPFNGFIQEVTVRPGDTVRQGMELARLDDRDTRLERDKVASQREQYEKQNRGAMAEHDRVQVRVLGAQIAQAQAQLTLLEEQLLRSTLVAPFDGVVLNGDLWQQLGAPVERGQALMEIAPLHGYRVILQVDDRDIAGVAVGQRGELVLSATAGQTQPFTVQRITAVNTTREGRNYFRVEAELDQGSEILRPGMEGIGKIDAGQRKLIWVWTHALTDWLRLWAWSWLP